MNPTMNTITFFTHEDLNCLKKIIAEKFEEYESSLDEVVDYSAEYLINSYFQS